MQVLVAADALQAVRIGLLLLLQRLRAAYRRFLHARRSAPVRPVQSFPAFASVRQDVMALAQSFLRSFAASADEKERAVPSRDAPTITGLCPNAMR
jgi:hypothetical protein